MKASFEYSKFSYIDNTEQKPKTYPEIEAKEHTDKATPASTHYNSSLNQHECDAPITIHIVLRKKKKKLSKVYIPSKS